jgi:IMP dehydrogenase
MDNKFPISLTFDDLLIVPNYSDIKSRHSVDTSTFLTNNIKLNSPVISSNMDSVTESSMAIAIAKMGGIGIIHRFLSIDKQADEVRRVKRYEGFIIEDPLTVLIGTNLKKAVDKMCLHEVSGLLVVSDDNVLCGLLTNRDIIGLSDSDFSSEIDNYMTTDLVTANNDISMIDAKELLYSNKIEKLPLVDSDNKVVGLITLKDIQNKENNPKAALDSKGHLLVGAAVGVKDDELNRAEELARAGVDVFVVDIAHGHSVLAIDMVKKLKNKIPHIPIIAGNVATKEGVRALAEAGAEAVKVGIGPGSICITRIVAGVGVPQASAIYECSIEARKHNVKVIADGGIRYPGDLTKAISLGADSVMIGSLLAGTDESPGDILVKKGRKFKISRGMASLGANLTQRGSYADKKKLKKDLKEVVPEGVEAVVPYKGSSYDVIYQLVGGLRSGMTYIGVDKIKDMYKAAKFVRITSNGLKESHSHDVIKD